MTSAASWMDAGTTWRGGNDLGPVLPRPYISGPPSDRPGRTPGCRRRECIWSPWNSLRRPVRRGMSSPRGRPSCRFRTPRICAVIHHPGVDRRHDLDGAVRARQLAGHRVRALAAGILDDAEVAVDAFLPGDPHCRSRTTPTVIVPVDFHCGRSTAIDLPSLNADTGQLAAPASHAAGRLGDDHALGVGHKNLPRRGIRGGAASAPHEAERGHAQPGGSRRPAETLSG